MSGNKMNMKKREERSKVNKTSDTNEQNDQVDLSLIRKPVKTNVTGFGQARKIFDQATEELKSLLTTECDLVYECKVCRNLFRSLANFISHKRVYCKEKFNSSTHGHFLKETSTIQEVLKIRRLEESYQESLNEQNELNIVENEDKNERIPITKDLTEIVEQMIKHKGVQDQDVKEKKLILEKIPKSSVAVYQNAVDATDDCFESMQTQIKELDDMLSKENAVLQSDGSLKINGSTNVDNVIQISDDDDGEETVLKCRICELQFSTQKTLKFHMKYKHLESRLVYPCPDCLDIFSTSWSVYRHLFKVHRKTAAQIKRLRESIQSKAFRMNNPPAFYEKRKTAPKVSPPKITEEERLEQENQAWLEQLDGEGDGRRCGGCGRAFERRAALAAHAHTCARRHRRRIQIQIRRDYHKEQANPYLAQGGAGIPESRDNTEEKMEIENTKEIPQKPVTDETVEEKTPKTDNIKPQIKDVMTIIPDIKEIELKEEKLDDEKDEIEIQTDECNDLAIQNKPLFYDSTLINKLPYAQQAEKSNLNAFKQKIQTDIDIDSLLCKKCDSKSDRLVDFLEHMGTHYKWMRYACKLCNFKHFNFDKLPEHVKVVHKLKGDSDFYYSTVKAIDGNEAKELAETVEESNDTNEVNTESRRPSRCSSDSSRLSDDSSSSSTREVGSRKRKSTRYKNNTKKKKENSVTDDVEESKDDEQQDASIIENDSSSNPKIFEENSSDLDDIEEKLAKRPQIEQSITTTSRRPIRKKTKPKYEDFEYDLSNLLKMDSQGYRDAAAIAASKTSQIKKKPPDPQYNYDLINKDCCGALTTLSRKSVEKAQSHMKTLHLFNPSKEPRASTVFARPMAPKVIRIDKISPRKDDKELKDTSTSAKVKELSNLPITNTSIKVIATDVTTIEPTNKIVENKIPEKSVTEVDKDIVDKPKNDTPKPIKLSKIKLLKDYDTKTNKESEAKPIVDNDTITINDEEVKSFIDDEIVSEGDTEVIYIKDSESLQKPGAKAITDVKSEKDTITNAMMEEIKDKIPSETVKSRGSLDTSKANMNMPLVPLMFGRKSLEVMKNPVIKKNITDFTKAGMKTKILVIKPINRNNDGNQTTPLKFQTFKLKEPIKKNSINEEKKEQVVVVQVPKVDCAVTRASIIATNNAVVSNSNLNNNKLPPESEETMINTKSSVIKEIRRVSDSERVIIDTCSESDSITVPEVQNIENTIEVSECTLSTSNSFKSDEEIPESLNDICKTENIEV